MSTRLHLSLRVVLFAFVILVPGVASLFAAEGATSGVRVPHTVRAEPELVDLLHRMLGTSPTFRAQCARLDGAERLVILLRLKPDLPTERFRARSSIRRYTSGLLIASIDVTPGSDQAASIAHEFEHVLELMDGRDLSTLARRGDGGVWSSVDGMVETQRALEAGRAVSLETKTLDTFDKFVE